MEPTKIIIWTDGSTDNHNNGGWACVIKNGPTLIELTGVSDNTTCNRMELTAAIEGLKSLSIPSEVEIFSDSAYLINTLNKKWYIRWFNEAQERPNLDLWRQLIGLSQFHNVTFIKVKGHSGDVFNERADRLAVQARKRGQK